MNSNPPRLKTLLIATALLLAALSAGTSAATAAPKKCPRGQVAWKLEGRSLCLAKPVAAGKRPTGPAMAGLWLREASRPSLGAEAGLSPALRRAVPRAGALLTREIGNLGGAGVSSADGGPEVERVNEVIGREELGGGVVAEGRIRGKVFGNEVGDLDVEFEMRDRQGNAVLYSPDYKSLFGKDAPVGCPTAAGLLTARTQGQMGGTVIRMKGKRVVGAKTVSQGWRIRARGKVGTDARLQSVTAEVTMTSKTFERGLRHEVSFTTAATVPRQGAPKAAGTPTASVSVRAAEASRAEEREYELESVRALVGAPETAQAVADVARHSRDHLLEAEPTWYALPNQCAQLAWAPAAAPTLEPGETTRVTGVVIAAADGAAASGGRIDVTGSGPGRLVAVTPTFSPAGPASFIAAAGEPNAANLSVSASAVATSTAGRAQATWTARATPVKLPERFVGTIASTKSMAGLTRSFNGAATYTRTSVVRGPDGSINAWYELTAATLGGAKEILGPPTGCRLEANGVGGQIESGDLELRVLPSGEAVYALLYDLTVPSQFVPTDCPPPEPSGFDGDISVFLNSRKPGPVADQMRPVGADFVIQENGVGDVTDLPDLTTTASWTLVPG